MPTNRDKIQPPESDGKVDDDMTKVSDQKQKRTRLFFQREHNWPSGENSEGAEAVANCIGWSRRSSGCTGGRLLRFGLWFICGTSLRPTGKYFLSLLERLRLAVDILGYILNNLSISPRFLLLRSRWLFDIIGCFSLSGSLSPLLSLQC